MGVKMGVERKEIPQRMKEEMRNSHESTGFITFSFLKRPYDELAVNLKKFRGLDFKYEDVLKELNSTCYSMRPGFESR